MSILASFVVPLGVSTVTNPAWPSGVALIGLAVLVAFIGVFGLVLRLDEVPWVAWSGVAASGIAGVVAIGWLAALGVLLSGPGVTWGMASEQMGLFRWSALVMASGFALGYLAVGTAHWREAGPHRRSGRLLVIGGVAFLVPVAVELLRPISGVHVPGWLLFAVLGFVALDTLFVGRLLHASLLRRCRQ